jgi:hypothetical protein
MYRKDRLFPHFLSARCWLQVPRLKAEALQRVLQALADAYAAGK